MFKNNLINKNRSGFATVEFIGIMPFYVLLLSVLILFGNLFREQLQMQYDNFNAALYVTQVVKEDKLTNKVDENNCKKNANEFLDGRGYEITCNFKNDHKILELVTSKDYKLTSVPLLEKISKRITINSYTYIY